MHCPQLTQLETFRVGCIGAIGPEEMQQAVHAIADALLGALQVFRRAPGPFAPEVVELGGARVVNAYHLPCVSAPPGSGIFFCEHSGRLNVTFSWRESCLSEEERRQLVAQTLADLVGEPCPALVDAGL